MVEIEFVKRVRVNGWWLLPGSRAEFSTAGQAGFFTSPGYAKLTKVEDDHGKLDPPKKKRTTRKTSESGGSETDTTVESV